MCRRILWSRPCCPSPFSCVQLPTAISTWGGKEVLFTRVECLVGQSCCFCWASCRFARQPPGFQNATHLSCLIETLKIAVMTEAKVSLDFFLFLFIFLLSQLSQQCGGASAKEMFYFQRLHVISLHSVSWNSYYCYHLLQLQIHTFPDPLCFLLHGN